MRCGLSRRRPVSGKKRILFLAAAFTALLVFFLECRLKPVLEEITKNEASALSVEAVNTAVNEALQEKGASYENLVQIERNNSGEILAVSSNVVQMNQLKTQSRHQRQNQNFCEEAGFGPLLFFCRCHGNRLLSGNQRHGMF